MDVVAPKFVALDSSTWSRLAQEPKEGDGSSRVLAILRSGRVVPFITWHHLQEIIQHGVEHGNAATFERRVELLRTIPFFCYPKEAIPAGNVGSIATLRGAEFRFLFSNPSASLEEVIAAVRGEIVYFGTGQQLWLENIEWWRFFREHFAAQTHQRQMVIANLTHFPAQSDDRPALHSNGALRLRSPQEAASKFKEMAETLTAKMRDSGDPRVTDPRSVAHTFMAETLDGLQPILEMEGNPEENLLKLHGVSKDRLPANPTMRDVNYEAIFVKQRELAAQTLDLPLEVLSFVRQEMVPSWVIWKALDIRMRRAPKAAGSNLLDKQIAVFAPYVHALEADKRVVEMFRQIGSSKSSLLCSSFNVFRSSSLDTLGTRLEELCDGSRTPL